MNDLTGQRFGRLVALEPTSERWKTSVVWRCACDCGNLCNVPSSWLRGGLKRSCGCLQDETRRTDISGQKRGHLTAICPTDQRRQGCTVWQWRCDCGTTVLKTPGMVHPGASTMCPACAKKLKQQQAKAMLARQVRDSETGMPQASLQGLLNGKLFRNNTSGVRGVSWHAAQQRWRARIHENGKMRTIGYYRTIEEAKAAREKAVLKKYGKPEQN